MEPISCPIRVSTQVNAPHSSRRSPQLSAVPRTHDCPLNVVIPMGGLGRNEFTNAGYPTPKPMIPVVGRPMLFWLLDNLDLRDTDAVWLGSKRDVEAEYGIEAAVRREYPSLEVHFVRFDFDTRGATETLYCVLNAMDANQRRRRTISLDCDTLWFCDVLGGARALPSDTGASFYFHDDAEDASAPYSYIRVDPRTQKIVDIREKVAISRLANNGAYVFASAAQALAGLEELLDEKVGEVKKTETHQAWVKDDDASSLNTALAQENPAAYSHRHHYVSGLIARLISNKAPFLAVRAKDFASLSTPSQLKAFLARLRRGEVLGARAMRFCFALDGTLVNCVEDDFEDATPIDKNIQIARQLHAAGHTIIIWTDRGMERGNAGSAMARAGAVTFRQLGEFGIPYDELLFGKPRADVYIDAQAISSLGAHIERSLGWDLETISGNSDLTGGVKPRHFNAVRRVGDDHVEKTGPEHILKGEIYWYQHIPPSLSDLFPQAVSVSQHPDRDLSSMVLTRVAGVTYSHLSANFCVTPGRLVALLDSLKRLHTCEGSTDQVSDELLCTNYARKVKQRYQKHEAFFRSFGADVPQLASKILSFLEDYESQKRFNKAGYIHGDPVFSNVLLTHDGRVKFLDMRGALGDVLTTCGDVAYDLSKVYQSLCGYDAIILDVPVDAAGAQTLAKLRSCFATWLASNYPSVKMRDVRLIVAAHYFCIVPLHDNLHHQRQFLAKARWLLEADDDAAGTGPDAVVA